MFVDGVAILAAGVKELNGIGSFFPSLPPFWSIPVSMNEAVLLDQSQLRLG